jgi:hypothetical protein
MVMAIPHQQTGLFGADLSNSGHVFRDRPRVPCTRGLGRSDRDRPDSGPKCTIKPTVDERALIVLGLLIVVLLVVTVVVVVQTGA